MVKINESEIKVKKSIDRNGFVFFWGDRVLRAIYPGREKAIQELLDCGLIAELVKENLFPKTTTTDYELNECSMILEHEKISPLLLPENWSFEMYKDACLCLLKVNRIASKYGYATIDSHGLNILFLGTKPKFIDLGSFIKCKVIKDGKVKGWRGLQEFMHVMYLPLKLKAVGWEYNICESYSLSIIDAYFKHPLISRLVTPYYYKILSESFYIYKMIHQIPDEMIVDHLKYTYARRFLAKMILFGKRWNLFPFTTLSFVRLEKRVAAVRKKGKKSRWGGYQDGFKSTQRFDKIIELFKVLPDCETVLKLGGNAGGFSRQLVENAAIKDIICSDYDGNAIDKLYDCLKQAEEKRIHPAVHNFRQQFVRAEFEPSEVRFRSDLVCVLALTHHLFLTQGLSPAVVFNYIRNHSKKYVAIEFMPLGLYTSKYDDTLTLPDWYSEGWFAGNFKKYFSVVSRTVLEENRILYIGEVLP